MLKKWMLLIAVLFISFSGCNLLDDLFPSASPTPQVNSSPTPSPTQKPALFLADTYNGSIYHYEIESNTCSGLPLLSVGQNATGQIYFYEGTGYVAVGSFQNTGPGLYAFNPSDAVPQAERIGTSISAQYCAFLSSTKAYVTDANYGTSTGLYTFNPGNPIEGLSGPLEGTDNLEEGMFLQDVVVGSDNRIYVADNGLGAVLQINPETDTVTGTFNTTAKGTTGLASGKLDNSSGIFAANSGGYDTNWNPIPGSIDFIDPLSGSVTAVIENVGAKAMVFIESDQRLYFISESNTYVADTSAAVPWIPVEIKHNDLSVGGSDLVLHDSFIYICTAGWQVPYNSKLYLLDTTNNTMDNSFTDFSPVSVMNPNEDSITSLAVYLP